jgi:MerR family transcriptional regulator, copper efflux regulator
VVEGDSVETLTIGKLAARSGVHLETIRFYEHEGLIPAPPRKESGHRAYSVTAVRRLRFIKRTQALGFSLAEIKELLSLRRDPDQLCTDVVHQIDVKTREVEEKIARLKAIRRALMRMRGSCEGACHVSECPILESLDSGLS